MNTQARKSDRSDSADKSDVSVEKTFICSVHVMGFVTVEVTAANEAEAKSKALVKKNWTGFELERHTVEPDGVESVSEWPS